MTGARCLLAALCLSGCASEYLMDKGSPEMSSADDPSPVLDETFDGDGAAEAVPVRNLWLEVQPLEGPDVQLQSFGPFLSPGRFELELRPSVALEGTVEGRQFVPWFSLPGVPTTATPVVAEVTVARPGTSQSWTTTTDDAGGWALEVVPDLAYTFSVIPLDPSFPTLETTRPITSDETVHTLLAVGWPVYGQLTGASGAAIPSADVYAVTRAGLVTASTTTDAGGWYSMQLLQGSYDLVTAGSASGRMPTLTRATEVIGGAGSQQDFSWAGLSAVFVSGGARDADGDAHDGIRVAFTSVSLDGYGDEAAYVASTQTDGLGNFDISLPPGTYDIEVWPTTDEDVGSAHRDGVVLSSSVELPVLELGAFRLVDGEIVDDDGFAVADAVLTCTESNARARFWSTQTAGAGQYLLQVPQSPMSCVVTPPPGRSDLAMLRFDVPHGELPEVVLLPAGDNVTGVITLEGSDAPVELAVVRLMDEDGKLWGSAITNGAGEFSFRATW